jgi:hypothetical protein
MIREHRDTIRKLKIKLHSLLLQLLLRCLRLF